MTKEEFRKLKVGDLISQNTPYGEGHMFGVWVVEDTGSAINPKYKIHVMKLIYSKVTNTSNKFTNFRLCESDHLEYFDVLGSSKNYPEYFI